jgi:hypothetical protein
MGNLQSRNYKPIYKTQKMKVQVKTKSNYKNLNNQWLEVKEIVGTRVTCIIDFAEFGKQTVDFTLSEVIAMDTTGLYPKSAINSIFEEALKPFGIR